MRVGVGVGGLGSCGRRAIVSIAILSIAIVSIAIGRVWVRVPGGYIYIYQLLATQRLSVEREYPIAQPQSAVNLRRATGHQLAHLRRRSSVVERR